MSFEDLKPGKPQTKEKPPVRIGMYARGDAPARMNVVLNVEVLDLIGGSDRGYRIQLGKDVDKHLLRIMSAGEDDLGLFKPSRLVGRGDAGRWWRFFLPRAIEQFPNVYVPLLEAKWEVRQKERALYITLPAWAWDPKSRDQMR